MNARWLTKWLGAAIWLTLISQGHGQTTVLTSSEIEKMLAAKISEAIIVARVNQAGLPIALSVDEIINLKKLGASDTLIESILSPSQKGAATAPARDTKLEVGVYARKAGNWVEVGPEVVNFKSSSPFKAYTFRMDMNGHIGGASSRTTLKTPIEIMLITAEGISASEFQLVRLRLKNTHREFRFMSSGLGGAKSGVDRDAVPYDFKKIMPGQFTINLPASVVAGEYAFLPPMGGGAGGIGSPGATLGKAYTFRVLE